MGSIPYPEGRAVEWLALAQAIRHKAVDDKTILTATNQMSIYARD